jgi:hypothetical protein
MHIVTLLAKAYDNSQLKQIDRNLKSTFEGLNVQIQICGTISRGWIEASVSGEDESAALNYLVANIGLCPTSLGDLEKNQTIQGRLTTPNWKENRLQIDIGIFSPQVIDASIPLERLQAQLTDGRNTPLRQLIDLFALCHNLPLTIKILNIDSAKNHVDAQLAEKQQRQYKNWTECLLDRVLVIGTSHGETETALQKNGLSRYVLEIDSLGIFEHAVVCKLGTDGTGLIPMIGRALPRASLSVFRPRKILNFLERNQDSSTA